MAWTPRAQNPSQWFVPVYHKANDSEPMILIFSDSDDPYNSEASRYRISDDKFEPIAQQVMKAPPREHRLAIDRQNDIIYLIGGKTNVFAAHCIASASFKPLAVQPQVKFGSYPSLCFSEDTQQLHIVGGLKSGKHYVFDPIHNTLSLIHDFGLKSMYGQGIAYCRKTQTLFVFGGKLDHKLSDMCFVYDGSIGWQQLSLPFASEGFGFVTVDDRFIVTMGGRTPLTRRSHLGVQHAQ